jgi:hypothetical protein
MSRAHAIIQYYNHLNGNSISLETLRAFRQRVQTEIDALGHGPNMSDLKGILERVGKAIKAMNEAGVNMAERVNLTPIALKTTPTPEPVKKPVEEKAVVPKASKSMRVSKSPVARSERKESNKVAAMPLPSKQVAGLPKVKKTDPSGHYIKEKGKWVPKPTTTNQPKKGLGIINASDIATMKFQSLPFDGKWKAHMGTPSENFSAMVWGKPKQGKSYYAFQQANYLSQFGRVLYVLSDEGIQMTVQEKIKATGLSNNKNVDFMETRQLSDIENALNKWQYEFIFIDLVNNIRKGDVKLEAKDFYALRKAFPRVGFIAVFSSTKDGNFRGENEWAHDVDVLVDVASGVASAQGRFGGGDYEIFKKSKAA